MENEKIGIMGGTFDPIHNGHLIIANEILDIYNLDKIIFIPTGNPPHKPITYADTEDRLLMTNLATISNDKFVVSEIETKNIDTSYTVNTIKELRSLHEKAEFYFILGSDAIIELDKWHQPEELFKLCKFIAVMRVGTDVEEVNNKISELIVKYKGNIELLELPLIEISSTDIRERIKNNKTIKYLLPETVELYIIKNKIYGENIFNIEEIKSKLKENIKPKLYEHCIRTMEESEKLAEVYNVNIEKAKIAALLHDCGKSQKENDSLSHSKLSAELAEKIYNISDSEILNAIRYHTTGREDMTLLEKIVFIADKIEPKRDYEGVEELRKLAYENINEALIKYLKDTIEYIKERNLQLDIESVKTLEFLLGGKI